MAERELEEIAAAKLTAPEDLDTSLWRVFNMFETFKTSPRCWIIDELWRKRCKKAVHRYVQYLMSPDEESLKLTKGWPHAHASCIRNMTLSFAQGILHFQRVQRPQKRWNYLYEVSIGLRLIEVYRYSGAFLTFALKLFRCPRNHEPYFNESVFAVWHRT